MHPLDILRHHVTGAIERGEAEPITEIPADGLTSQQILWAKSHDWFRSSNGSSIDVLEVVCTGNEVIETLLTFTSFRKLYRWAGY